MSKLKVGDCQGKGVGMNRKTKARIFELVAGYLWLSMGILYWILVSSSAFVIYMSASFTGFSMGLLKYRNTINKVWEAPDA